MSQIGNNDYYHLSCCELASEKSNCHSRKIGAILIANDGTTLSSYNGPPDGVPECKERYLSDHILIDELKNKSISKDDILDAYTNEICPRKLLGFKSGEGLEWCNAIHAEKRCILLATKMGINVKGATLYINTEISPCTQCLGACIEVGIKEVVVIKNNIYDKSLMWTYSNGNIKIREFKK